MKWKALVREIALFGLTALMVDVMLTGCGSGTDDTALTVNEASADAEEAAEAVEAPAEEEEQSKDNAKTSGPVSIDGSNPFDTAAVTDEERNLTGDELKAIEEAFNSSKYNGFLSTEFKSPKDIWWDEVFYNGAELESKYDDDTISDVYLKETGDEELFGSLTYFTSGDMERFIESATGMSVKKMKHPIEWMYLEDYDLYVSVHGDTNYSPVKAISGTAQGDRYTVQYSKDFLDIDENTFEVVFDKSGEDYVFASNLWAPEGGREAGVKAIYDELIAKYAIAVANEWDENKLRDANISAMCADEYTSGDALTTIGYYLHDVNGDGTDELIFGADHGKEKTAVYEAYSIKDGSWNRILMSYEDSLYYLANDDSFYCEEKMHDGSMMIDHMEMYGAYGFLTSIDAVKASGGKYYYSEDSFWKDNRTVSEAEFDEYCERASNSYADIKYIPLSTVDIAALNPDITASNGKESSSESGSDASAKSGGYTDKELCDMALDHYEKENGYRPGVAEVEDREVDIVLIHLYDDMGDHTATSAWYEIDSRTGKGKDTIFGDKIDLTK